MHYVDVLVCIYVYKYILKLTNVIRSFLYFGDGFVYSSLPSCSNRIEISISICPTEMFLILTLLNLMCMLNLMCVLSVGHLFSDRNNVGQILCWERNVVPCERVRSWCDGSSNWSSMMYPLSYFSLHLMLDDPSC